MKKNDYAYFELEKKCNYSESDPGDREMWSLKAQLLLNRASVVSLDSRR